MGGEAAAIVTAVKAVVHVVAAAVAPAIPMAAMVSPAPATSGESWWGRQTCIVVTVACLSESM